MFEQVKEALRKQLKLGDREITMESKIKDDLKEALNPAS